ncbi:MAG: serine/threonine protein kinase, partial [Planctomycetes bacterium]|nr:serine/threonine protein kinase [Planctomycetota bacterium]
MPALKPDDVLRYLGARGYLAAGEVEFVQSRWNPERDGALLSFVGRERLLPQEVADDLVELLSANQLEGIEPHLPGLMLLHLVGRGGRGNVYRAWQASLRRVVAVKILSRALSGNREYLQRFLREAKVASRVQHKNIVRAYDINKKGADVFMVMEYVSGVSLGVVLRNRTRLPVPEALEIGRLAAEAVAYIGKVGLVHRDIKPDNIMLDRKGRVKLCDLGLARPSGTSSLTAPMVAQGTPLYMAPENALGGELDSQADVYSLGVTLYRALLGKPPFDNPDPVEVLRMHVEVQPRGLDGDELPAGISNLLRRMLEKNPTKRPLARDLPREFAALQSALPGMASPRLWELVPGGAPTALLAYESELDLAPEDAPEDKPETYKAWEDPALAQRPAPAQRGGRSFTGIGLGTLAAALVLAVLYIVFASFGDPPTPPEDPQVPGLKQRITQLETDAQNADYERDRLA